MANRDSPSSDHNDEECTDTEDKVAKAMKLGSRGAALAGKAFAQAILNQSAHEAVRFLEKLLP